MIHYDSKARAFGFASFIFMMAVLSFSSCIDMEDTNKSMVLSGEWRGDFGMYYDYRDDYGRVYTFDSYDTYLTFIPAYSYANYGRGTQVDYYDYGPYEYQYYKFRWSVENGYIYLTYDYDPQLNNWTPYVNSYGYWDRDNWGYYYPYFAPATRSDVEQPEDSTSNVGEVVGRGRRSTSLKQ